MLFKEATQKKYRYPSSKGNLSTEDLWDLPLTSKRGDSLNSVAVTLSRMIKDLGEESFVPSVPSIPGMKDLQGKLEVVKKVIEQRVAENEALRDAAARKLQREKLKAALADKQEESLKSLSEEELKEKLKELG